MIALEVMVNGRKVALAGAESLSSLSAFVNAFGELGTKSQRSRRAARAVELFLHVGGLASPEKGSSRHLRWTRGPVRTLAIGDEVTVRIVRAKSADPPKSSRSLSHIDHERANREHAKKASLAGKEKFETEARAKTKRGPRRSAA